MNAYRLQGKQRKREHMRNSKRKAVAQVGSRNFFAS